MYLLSAFRDAAFLSFSFCTGEKENGRSFEREIEMSKKRKEIKAIIRHLRLGSIHHDIAYSLFFRDYIIGAYRVNMNLVYETCIIIYWWNVFVR